MSHRFISLDRCASLGRAGDPSWAAHAAGLRALFCLLITAAGRAAFDSDKGLRLMRLIRRTARLIMAAETADYQRRVKFNMLRSPLWRERFRRGVKTSAYHEIVSGTMPWADMGYPPHNRPDKARNHNTVKTDSASQFCLAPLPRGFHGRASFTRSADSGPRAFKSPMDVPIPLHPNEISPPQSGGARGGHGGGGNPPQYYDMTPAILRGGMRHCLPPADWQPP